MNFLYSLCAAFSMFSALPAPQVPWEKEKIRYMLAALPLVGLVIGGAECLWFLLRSWLSFGPVLHGVGMTLIPLSLYSKKALIKLEIALCRGKTHADRREDLRKRK